MTRTPLHLLPPLADRPAPGHAPVSLDRPRPPATPPRPDAEAELLAFLARRVLGAR